MLSESNFSYIAKHLVFSNIGLRLVSNICWWHVSSEPSSVIVMHLVGAAVNIDYTLHDVLLLEIILNKIGMIKSWLHLLLSMQYLLMSFL
jgi:hypothetical protein